MERRDDASPTPSPTDTIRTVWVSGSSGRLGREVVRQLRDGGFSVLEADIVGENAVDLLEPAAVAASMVGADAIIHCAAIPSPGGIDPAELVHINSLTCFNALEQAWLAGVGMAVLASSGSIYGTAWAGEWAPEPVRYDAVPVDENTPLVYVDPYALTKDVTEAAGRMFHRRGMTVTALRFHWIATAEQARAMADGEGGDARTNDLWGYVDLRDAARASILSLAPTPEHRGYEALVIAAADTASHTTTAELLDRHLPAAERRREVAGTAGLFDCSRAAATIDWRPENGWRSE
ncbi:NAD-dependent epimerase/dehydratase family protein [Labedella endophytica]|uniref:NAD(P)-dependent oxidoreductase n=1 Tax=Labedella endophytica TaxID=1523160 RepID=A0A433JP96_9MICO|nr:NAD(P)-dependent oxidoreductase [Labedella endophytica]RUQ98259.1 NAD(P)-dependent oxidoreductase [Labedella endophytica]